MPAMATAPRRVWATSPIASKPAAAPKRGAVKPVAAIAGWWCPPAMARPRPMPPPRPASPARAGTAEAPPPFVGMVAAHNAARDRYGLPPLTWSAELATIAQAWADQLKAVRQCAMEHSHDNRYGENLAWSRNMHPTPADIVRWWVDEASDYDLASNTCASGKMCGHFTQVVWKTTLQIGCGVAHCGKDEVWACEYAPPGNWVGRRPF